MTDLQWRGHFENEELDRLHSECFDHPLLRHDWRTQLEGHSLGWVCGRARGQLVGFVHVAWDGGIHSFLLDTMVTSSLRRQGLGSALVHEAVAGARAAGCEWIHVDFDAHLKDFYEKACGFASTRAGLIRLGLPDATD